MAEKTKTEIIVIHETVLHSWARDAGTFAVFVAFIALGWMVDSAALQWVGAILAFIALFQRASGRVTRLTINEARAKLDEIEKGAAHG